MLQRKNPFYAMISWKVWLCEAALSPKRKTVILDFFVQAESCGSTSLDEPAYPAAKLFIH